MKRINKNAVLALCALVSLVTGAAFAADGVVNINSADAETLALLPRVGPSVAQRIIDFRSENGDFSAVEDLLLVRGIGDRTFELIEPYASISGDSTLTEKVRVSREAADKE